MSESSTGKTWRWLSGWGLESLKTPSLTHLAVDVGSWEPTGVASCSIYTGLLPVAIDPHSLVAGFEGKHLKKNQAGTVMNFMTYSWKSHGTTSAIVINPRRFKWRKHRPHLFMRKVSKTYCTKGLWDERYCWGYFLKMQSATVFFAQECTMDRDLGGDPRSRVSRSMLRVNSSQRLKIVLWHMIRLNKQQLLSSSPSLPSTLSSSSSQRNLWKWFSYPQEIGNLGLGNLSNVLVVPKWFSDSSVFEPGLLTPTGELWWSGLGTL